MNGLNISKNLLIFISCIFWLPNIIVQGQSKYWIQFTDKNNNPYSIGNPEQFLSSRAIQRRIKNEIPVTEQDLPVLKEYLDSISGTGVTIKHSSKWFNSVTVEVDNESVIAKIRNFSFVKNIEKTADPRITKSAVKDKFAHTIESPLPGKSYYNLGYAQIKLENGISLHDMGFTGKDVQIAITDVGFLDADKYISIKKARDENRILGTRNYVTTGQNVYTVGSHGSEVLSTIASDLPETFVGTAPEASFWLIRSEDENSEFPVEEDNWVAAAEFADSAGVDVINTSLGYFTFNNPQYNHTYSDMDGKSTRISIAASIASAKGIVVVVSAGNEGVDKWHYIDAPADAYNILAVGAVRDDSIKAAFSSYGPSYDNRIKPEIMGMGAGVTVEASVGEYGRANGTSFSSPIIAGLVACLIQAFPKTKSNDIINAVIRSAHLFENPNNAFGYGIPDFGKAYELLKNTQNPEPDFAVFPNPFSNYLFINCKETNGTVLIQCFNNVGKMVFELKKNAESTISIDKELSKLSSGVYYIVCTSKNKRQTIKAIKLQQPVQ